MKKFRIKNCVEVLFAGQVMLRDLKGLFEETLLHFDKESIIPGKDSDLTVRTGNLTNNAHSNLSCPKVVFGSREMKCY